MSVEERDKYTGYLTTGHDWNGISELNTRVPRILLFFLLVTFLFSIGYWYLMPAWPGVDDYTHGKLGIDQRDIIATQLETASAMQTRWSDKLETASFDEIVLDRELMAIVSNSAPALFRDNCAMCHGEQGNGQLYFPRLTDSSWLWGAEPDSILKTLQVGINATNPSTRVALMPAFGNTGVLDATAAGNVATYVRSLSNALVGNGSRVEGLLAVRKGQALFQQNCIACHGPKGEGNTALGAPDLTDSYWIYGGDQKSIVTTVHQGRAGHMPAWKDRLSNVQLKILALYVANLADRQSVNSAAE